MHRVIKCILAVFLLNVSSCGVIKDRSTEYAEANVGIKLTIPDGYNSEKVRSRYPVPEIENVRMLAEKFQLPEPPNATAALNNEPYLIETVDKQTWLRLYTSPGKVWPLLDFFWSEYGINVANEDISSGFLVTDVTTNNAALNKLLGESASTSLDANNIAFQAKLNQGVRRNTAELQIRAINSKVNNQWQNVSVNPELELAMLSIIGDFISSDAHQNRYSLLANDIGGESRIRLLQDEAGLSYIELKLSFERSWSEIGKALASANVVVSDLDRSQKTYFISYLQEDELSVWYDLGASDEEKRKERNLALVFTIEEDGRITVRAKLLNDKFDGEKQYELLNIVFEHIS